MSPSQKAAAVARVEGFLLDGHSLNKSCELAQVPKASYKGWKSKLMSDGMIRDRRTEASGRKPKFQLTVEEINALRGLTAKHGSFAFAVEIFARCQECTDTTSEMIMEILAEAQRRECQPKFPVALQRIARSSDLEDDMIRGPKATLDHAKGSVKGMFWENEKGEIIPINPLSVWMLDDYSTNEPYIIPTEENGRRLCRQILAALDVYSSGWLGVHHVGRERDAYRVEDILRFILNLIDAQGTMPEALMLEQGRWKAEAILGIEHPDFSGRRWGGLKDLFHVIHGFTSRHKAALESNFRILQTALRLSGRSIGSFRGEMESGTKSYLAVQKGKIDPVKAGFLTTGDSSQIHLDAMAYLNSRAKMRKAFDGRHLIPDVLLQDPWTARPLPYEERWRFHPVKKIATVKNNMIEVRAGEHYTGHFIFRVNGVKENVYLQSGHKVFVAFDPLKLHLGAAIANADQSTLNRDAWRMGQMMIPAAPAYEMTPQFSFRPRTLETTALKKTQAAVASMFKAIKPFCKPGLAISHVADGKGNSQETRRNEPPTANPAPQNRQELPEFGVREASRPTSGPFSGEHPTRRETAPKSRISTDLDDLDETAILAAEQEMSAQGWGE